MAELSEDDVIEILGPVSDALAAEIIATGIDRAGLVAARDRVRRDRKTHRHDIAVEPGPFGEVVDILERARGLLGRGGSTLEARQTGPTPRPATPTRRARRSIPP